MTVSTGDGLELHACAWAPCYRQRILDAVEPATHPHIHSWLQTSWPALAANATKQLPSGSSWLDVWQRTQQQYTALERAIDEASHAFQVMHLDKLLRRVQRETREITDPGPLLQQTGTDLSSKHDAAAPQRLQGLLNNLIGFGSEFHAALAVRGVIAVSHVARCAPGNGPHVEVDVVGSGGLVYFEIKAVRGSVTMQDWTGLRGGGSATRCFRDQVSDYCRVAASPCSRVSWLAPQVVLYFPFVDSIDAAVLEDIQRLGVRPISQLDNLYESLEVPTKPTCCNLDATALCALVSQISNDHADQDVYRAWACSNQHWQRCFEHECKRPVVPALMTYIEGMQWIASKAAVDTFEGLLAMYAGAKERARWTAVRRRLSEYDSSDPDNRSDRVDALDLGSQQKEMFGLGDAKHAVLVTANARAVHKAHLQGVALDAIVHHAIWLTGM